MKNQSHQNAHSQNLSSLLLWINVFLSLFTCRAVAMNSQRSFNLKLEDMTSEQGTIFRGANPLDNAGYFVGVADNLRGNNIPTYMISAVGATYGGRTNAGCIYLINSESEFGAEFDLNDFNENFGSVIVGALANDTIGVITSAKVDNDEFDDIIVGASRASYMDREMSGILYVIKGGTMLPPVIDLANLSPDQGKIIVGAKSGDSFGRDITVIPNFAGNDQTNLIASAPFASSHSFLNNGNIYLFNDFSTLPDFIDLNDPKMKTHYKVITGDGNFTFTGRYLGNAGKMNDDMFPELLIGAQGSYAESKRNSEGRGFILYGSDSFDDEIHLGKITKSKGIVISTEKTFDGSDVGLFNVGDQFGQGISSILVTAPQSAEKTSSSRRSGNAYLLEGKSSLPNMISTRHNDFTMLGATPEAFAMMFNGHFVDGQTGDWVTVCPDINGDDRSEILISTTGASRVSMIFDIENMSGSILLSDDSAQQLNNTYQIINFIGEEKSLTGISVATSNGKGNLPSILIGAPKSDVNGQNAGSVYLYNVPSTLKTPPKPEKELLFGFFESCDIKKVECIGTYAGIATAIPSIFGFIWFAKKKMCGNKSRSRDTEMQSAHSYRY